MSLTTDRGASSQSLLASWTVWVARGYEVRTCYDRALFKHWNSGLPAGSGGITCALGGA